MRPFSPCQHCRRGRRRRPRILPGSQSHRVSRPLIHTQTVESYFSVFKRGMRGTYQHCKEKHLHRYLAEFDFRHNNRSALGVEDKERARKATIGAKGKRLTYR